MSLSTDCFFHFVTADSSAQEALYLLQDIASQIQVKTVSVPSEPPTTLLVGSVLFDRILSVNYLEALAGSCLWISNKLLTNPIPFPPGPPLPFPAPPNLRDFYSDQPEYFVHKTLNDSIRLSILKTPLPPLPPVPQPYITYDCPHFFNTAELNFIGDFIRTSLNSS